MESTCAETDRKESSNSESLFSFNNSLNNEMNMEQNSENPTSHIDPIKDYKTGERKNVLLSTDFETNLPEKQLYKDFSCKDTLSDLRDYPISSLDVKGNKLQNNEFTGNAENSNEVDVKEYDLLKNNIVNSHMDDIRRLSVDIVKEVIESAISSVQHIYSNNKSKQDVKHKNGCTDKIIRMDDNGDRKLENVSCKLEINSVDAPSTNYVDVRKTFTDLKNQNMLLNNQDHKKCLVDEETICGYGCFKPKWIQRFATPKVFLLFFTLIGVTSGTYYAYFVSIISTLEKQYAFKTKISVVLMLPEEITPLLLGVFVGGIGDKIHRPRMIAFGMFLAAVSCFIAGMPHLVLNSTNHIVFYNIKNETGPEICKDQAEIDSCNANDRPPTTSAIAIFLLSNFFKGLSTVSYQIIGMSYMDDIIKRKNSPLYFAISLALRLLGPLVGFLMSSAFLKIYENPFEDPGFGTDDPRWIGAWWMGFFLQGVLLLIFTIPIALFPRRLPGQKILEKPPTTPQSGNIRDTLAGLLSALKRLAKNPIFIIVIINTTMKIFGHFGHSIMLPKYMENQFRLSAADASLFSGATSIFCIMIATIFGGFMIWKFRPRIKLLLAGMVVSEVMLCIGFLVLMIPRCHPADLSHFGMNDEGLILNSVCNQNCDCSKTSFTPFCGPDGKTTYFSPCYAGCTEELTPLLSSKKQKEFGNCSCLNHINNSSDLKITEGFCPDDNCWSQAVAYLIILFILLTLSNTFTVAHTMILLRSVHPTDKSVALGTFETCICLFGFIPFPVTFGALVDSACLIWEESCGETGNCWFYDMDSFAFLLHGAAAIFCSLSVVCLIAIYVLSSRIKNLYEDEQEEEQNIDNIKLDTTSGSVTAL